ncbi:g3584 [Coccomyxa elongata]
MESSQDANESEDKGHARTPEAFGDANVKVNGEPFDAGQYSFFGDLGDDGGLEDELGGLEDGIEAPPEEELLEDPDLGLIPGGDEEIEDLSYATMFANTLDLGADTPQQPERMRMDDPIIERPSPSVSTSLGGRGEGLRSSIGLGDMSSPLPISSTWGGHGDASNNAAVQNVISAYGSPGLPGLTIPPLNQGPSPYGQLQRPDHAQFSAPPQQSGFFPEQAPVPSAPQHALQHQPTGPVKISRPMTVDELEAQLLGQQRSHTQQQQQSLAAPQLQPGMHGFPPTPPNAALPRPQAPPRHVQMGPGQEQMAYTGLHPTALGMGLPGPGLMPQSHDRSFAGGQPSMGNMAVPGPRPPPYGPPPPMAIPGHRPPPPQMHSPLMHPGLLEHGTTPPGMYGSPGMMGPPRGMPYGPGHPPDRPPVGRGGLGDMGAWGRGPHDMHGRGLAGPHQAGPFPLPGPGFFPPRPSREAQYGNGMLGRRRAYGSKHMSTDEIEQILRIQWKSLHSGVPYHEDYYYQAYVNKHRAGRNTRWFTPEGLRELGPSEKVGMEPMAYVKLEGLGKIPFSNIRRPRPLMDLEAKQPASDEDGEAEGAETAAVRRRLEDEPLLAARIVVEDCLNLLLDVDDIDRMWAASGAQRDNRAALCQRRSLLLKAVTRNLRIPDAPKLPAEGAGDGVFLRLMALPKGRGMLTRALRLLYAPLSLSESVPGAPVADPASLQIAWALLRNVRTLFGRASSVGQKGAPRPGAVNEEIAAQAAERDIEVTSNMAVSAAELLKRLDSGPAVNGCMAALVAGDLMVAPGAGASRADCLLPLYVPGERAHERHAWLSDILIALLQRAQELGLAEYASERRAAPDNAAAADGKAWRSHFGVFFTLVLEHVSTLVEVFTMANAAGAMEAADYARQIVPVNLVRNLLPHATDPQREQLRAKLALIS